MPIQGFTRLRKHQFGRQSAFGTKVAAVRAYPYSGTPSPDLNWVDPEGDFGSLVDVAPPYRGAPNHTFNGTIPTLGYNDLPQLMSGFFGGGVDPVGAGDSKTWTHEPDAEDPDDFDPWTYEFGDDVLTDWEQYGDGVITQITINGPVGLGALSASVNWLFGSYANTGSTDLPVSGTVPTPGLAVDRNPVPVFLKDLGIWIDSDGSGLGGTQILNALHNFTLTFTQTIDVKRFANADQSFDADGYGRGPIVVELRCRFAKTADTVGIGSESDNWTSETTVDRYVRLATTSKVIAEADSGAGDIPYSWTQDMAMRYRTREHDAEGGNSVIALMGRAFLAPASFSGFYKSEIVNTLAAAGA